ncbi:MAG: DUF503 domain-containing protein [Anaerolineae bacterium]|nr:DUF503 domain-containing protein [Anaerolineae bacterium]MCB9106242.1 DUF503 domain-containing protein [Anaerolineales bacterium]
MVIGVCTIDLDIPMSTSLKDKRQVIRSVTARLRKEFNVAISEVERQDARQTTVLAVVSVSNDRDYVHGLLTRVIQWIEKTRLDCVLVDYYIELI